ncbi:hypothetical protein B7P43_G00642 [Cryptotermes secundus]|uniref:SURP motif domain-containing protein n=2 Tax=Cryptotermes secundus TaxID=105785 RepID=A0A2J7QAM9_9NEOP|nr:hypothetical protein B7P43_G00642 [Cryptotermes secundus]
MAACRQVWLSNDSGILRKKEDEDELLVFGYSCKLFRDDEKAIFIDQGKHLIPWMGDESLKIDRYDGRGALYDLKQYEAQPGGHDANRWVGLSDAERRVEQLCDEERYRALYHNEEEEALYQEEELKRLHKALGSKSYGEVAFNYDEDQGSGKHVEKVGGEPAEEEVEGGDEPFIAPPELDIPINMTLPDSVKLNAIIEKTALFISQQGAQMEILLKMKQANNPQFQFLSFDSPLHPYYRHLLMAIKTGRYRPKTQEQDKEGDQDDGNDDHYLHPSLAPGSSRVELAPSIPSINYKPSADCAYSMLVNKIKNRQASFSVNPLQQPPVPGTSDPILPMQYQQAAPSHIIQASPVLYRHDPVSKEVTAPTSTTYQHISVRKTSHNGDSSDEDVYGKQVDSVYSGGHSSSRSVSPEMFTHPPPDMQLIIDKMASYVAKNGRDFEAIVRSKGDSRFAFLDVNHPFFQYYQHKLGVYEKLEVPAVCSSVASVGSASGRMEVDDSSQDMNLMAGAGEDSRDSSDKSSDGSRQENCKQRSKPAPVCFSIKKPKESEALLLEKRSALPVEESSDEEEGQEKDKDKAKVEEKKKVEENVIKEEKEIKVEAEVIDLTESTTIAQPVTANTTTVEENGSSSKEKKGSADKAKWAEERLKDRLAAAAREKIAAAAREKQLQLERKRRAAAFLNMIRKDHPLGTLDSPIIGPQLPDGAPVQRISDDEGEVSSVPSPTSFSDVPSPQLVGNGSQELEDRLNPKQNGDAQPQTTSLYVQIQESKQGVKRRNASSSSESGNSSDHTTNSSKGRNHIHMVDKYKRKKKKISGSHKMSQASSLSHSHFRSFRHKKHDEHMKSRKSKKKARSRYESVYKICIDPERHQLLHRKKYLI